MSVSGGWWDPNTFSRFALYSNTHWQGQKQRSFTICPFLIATFRSNLSAGLTCWVHSHAVKVPLLQHKSSFTSQLEAYAKCLNSHESSCASQLVARAKCLNSHESIRASLLAVRAKCLNKSNAFTFKLIVGFIQKLQSQLQKDLVDLSLSNAFSIVKLNFISIKANENLQITNDCQQGAAPHSNIRELIISSKCNPTFKGAQTANKSLKQIVGYSILTADAPELIVESSYIASSFQDFSSNDFQLVVEFTLILDSEGAFQPFNWAPAFTTKLIVASTSEQRNLILFGNSHYQLVVNCRTQSLTEKDIEADLNFIRYLSSILWQINKILHRLIVVSVSEGAWFDSNLFQLGDRQ